MAAFRGPKASKVWLWRWRRNPLRRRSDVLEAWIVLVAWALTALGGVLTGLLATQSVENGLARQRAEWHSVPALLNDDVPKSTAASRRRRHGVGGGPLDRAGRLAARRLQARVSVGSPAGTPVMVWTDADGRLVTKPPHPPRPNCVPR